MHRWLSVTQRTCSCASLDWGILVRMKDEACPAGTRAACDVLGNVQQATIALCAFSNQRMCRTTVPAIPRLWRPAAFGRGTHASPYAVSVHRMTESAQTHSGWEHEDQTSSRSTLFFCHEFDRLCSSSRRVGDGHIFAREREFAAGPGPAGYLWDRNQAEA